MATVAAYRAEGTASGRRNHNADDENKNQQQPAGKDVGVDDTHDGN